MGDHGMEGRDLTHDVIGCAFRVYGEMGFGFLETVYEKCMLLELAGIGIPAESQKPVSVYYQGEIVGNFVVDLLVAEDLIVELKSVRTLVPAHEMQLVNYLKATRLNVGLLINFGERKVEVKRKLRVLPRQES